MLRYFVVISLLFISPTIADEATDKAEFNAALIEYTELLATPEKIDEAINAAKNAHNLARKIYGRFSQEYAILKYNIADLYDVKGGEEDNDFEQEAFSFYREYFKIIDRLKIPRDRDYLTKYLSYATVAHNVYKHKASDRHQDKMLGIAKNLSLEGEELGDLYFNIAMLKINAWQANEAWSLLDNARNEYRAALGDLHLKIADTSFWMGKLKTAWQLHDEAYYLYTDALRIFKNHFDNEENLPVHLHAFMANLYHTVQLPDEATKHVLATAAEIEPEGVRIVPLYRSPEIWPEIKAKRVDHTQVTLKFTVDTQGRAKDFVVDNTTDPHYDQAAIATVKQYRFSPVIDNGELVDVPDVKLTVNYIIEMRGIPSWRHIGRSWTMFVPRSRYHGY